MTAILSSLGARNASGWLTRAARSPVGAVIARPWIDPVGLAALRRWYFPLSRLWAAANAAEGDADRFIDASGAELRFTRTPSRLITGVLARHERARTRAAAARMAWEDAAFGDSPPSSAALAALDLRRRVAATAHLATRGPLWSVRQALRVPLARWDLPSPDAVDAIYGAYLDRPADLFAAGDVAPSIARSASFERDGLRETWLRFRSPARELERTPGSETAYARIVEPLDMAGVPTIVSGSGLCVESDLMVRAIDGSAVLSSAGFRVVEMVSPYHGLRAAPDRYGGEPFFATAPLGALDLIAAQTRETAAVVAWCRAAYGGPVAVGGISMTSFVAQQIATYCGGWPAAARPDAILLVSHSARMEEVVSRGSLVRALGLDRRLAAAGWDAAALARVAPLANPGTAPSIAPERIVSVLGTGDALLPYATGKELTARWRLPAGNMFDLGPGHFAMPLALLRDRRPLERLAAIMRG
ncbi:MAG: hypothetical protein IPK81_17815 [Rhodospirillales bacterium]|nr:MAG: hypothetical protein IPK81_17815 [Rhodospirillales bacterium]